MSSPLVQRFRNEIAPRLLDKFNNGGVKTVVTFVTEHPDPLRGPTLCEDCAIRTDIDTYVSGVSSSILASDVNLVVSDLQVIVAALNVVPEVGELVEINGDDRRILRVDAIPAAGPPAIYRFFVR